MDLQKCEAKKISMLHELKEFHAVFDELIDEITKEGLQDKNTRDAFQLFKEILLYNLPHGKKNKGVSVVIAYKQLVPNANSEQMKIARIIGWCGELDGVGMRIINDCYFLETCVYKMIKRYTYNKPYYVPLMELFLETTSETTIGQCMDIITVPSHGKLDFTKFNMDRYSVVSKQKSAFFLPVAIPMCLAGITDKDVLSKAKEILLEVGFFFQVEDDYLDCFGDPMKGETGSDIQERKCTWNIITALEVATEDQKKTLQEYYERCSESDKEAVEKVTDIFKELNLEALYKCYKEESYNKVTRLIDSLDVQLPKCLFYDFVNEFYGRHK